MNTEPVRQLCRYNKTMEEKEQWMFLTTAVWVFGIIQAINTENNCQPSDLYYVWEGLWLKEHTIILLNFYLHKLV